MSGKPVLLRVDYGGDHGSIGSTKEQLKAELADTYALPSSSSSVIPAELISLKQAEFPFRWQEVKVSLLQNRLCVCGSVRIVAVELESRIVVQYESLNYVLPHLPEWQTGSHPSERVSFDGRHGCIL